MRVETKRAIKEINKTKSWFFEIINKIDKPLSRIMRGKKRKISKTMNQKWKDINYNGQCVSSKYNERLLWIPVWS